MKNLLNLLLFFVLLMSSATLWATHNRAGEISYVSEPLPGEPYRYRITINTYTKFGNPDSDAADRDSLEINFGDGSALALAPRINGNGQVIDAEQGVKKNVYQITHAYASPFNYVISMQDPNRVSDIINIQFGNSVNIPFYIQDTIFFRDPQFYGYNSSPILYQPPIDYGNVGEIFIHNPNAFDPDGDSLHFELIAPLAGLNNPVPAYQYPNQVSAGANNQLTLDPNTGELVWNTPQQKGIYNIAFLIREFRNGVQISNMIRDMQVIVEDVNNRPPVIKPTNDTCLVIGNTLILQVSATDPDSPGQVINLTAYGGPLELPQSPATFQSSSGLAQAQGTLTWNTTCDHIYSQKYTIVFRAEDNFSTPLVDLETWRIQLIAPPPTNLQATIDGEAIRLDWNVAAPYVCAQSPKFRGYSVWRRNGCDSLTFDICQQGLNGTDYIKIAEGITTNTYTDNTVQEGIKYSYRVVAEFADDFTASNPPTPINISSSAPSLNVCAELPKDSPIITNVSIENTATTNGQIYVAWSKPRALALDTLQNPPPYRYELYRADGINGTNFALINTATANTYATANDTTYLDTNTNLNTQDNSYSYKIKFFSNNEFIDETQTASSVFLNIAPADNQLTLTWQFAVPWLNYQYKIYKRNNITNNFEFLGQTANNTYTDVALQNGETYCYYIETIGTYSTDDLIEPIINKSQIVCKQPTDLQPPCTPQLLSISNNCNLPNSDDPNQPLFNNLVWQQPTATCADDISQYYIYYQAPLSPNFELIDSVQGATLTAYIHYIQNSLTGCYAVAAVDSFYNISPKSNILCAENCPLFELPNVFTPNNDNDNDFFIPRKARFVNSVDFKVFNRWGGIVYQTTDPQLNWAGIDSNTNKDVPDGVYYYTCQVFELTADGITRLAQSLSGYIHVIRGE